MNALVSSLPDILALIAAKIGSQATAILISQLAKPIQILDLSLWTLGQGFYAAALAASPMTRMA